MQARVDDWVRVGEEMEEKEKKEGEEGNGAASEKDERGEASGGRFGLCVS